MSGEAAHLGRDCEGVGPHPAAHRSSEHYPVTSKQFLVVAGEASGDMYGAQVARALEAKFRGSRVFGLGGERMREAGVESVADITRTAVVGPFEAMGHIGALYSVFRKLSRLVEDDPPSAAILIDFPDFNLRLAGRLKALGVPVVYYISPQVWAWRPGRVRQIREVVDKMLVILPFEEEIYRRAGIDVEFVGHPLLDTVRPRMTRGAFHAKYRLNNDGPLVALLPGSRRKELRYILPTVCLAVDLILAEKPDTQFVLPVASGLSADFVQRFLGARPIRLVRDDTYDAIRYSRAAIVASGTATLETALLGTPEVIVYRIGRATWLLGKFLLRVRMFGLVNIISGEEVVPELYQNRMTPANVAEVTLKLMDDVWAQSEIRGNYEKLRRKLGAGNVAEKVADAVAVVVSSSRR
jgi:lipid-A-disaccharide synthase